MARYDETTVDGELMRICVGEPAGRGPHPAILLAFHRHGFSPFTADVVAQFSAAGYLIAAPDLYHRCGNVSADEAVKRRRDDHVLADMAAALRYLQDRPDVDRDRLIIAGHCMGGRIAFLIATTWPDTFKACLSYYGGGMFLPWGSARSPFEQLGAIRCPVAGFFGNNDDNPTPADVDRIEAELKRVGVQYETHRYDGAGHGYMARGSKYHESATLDSWRCSFAFLERLALAPTRQPAKTPAA
jgi:carboxymethylenebutenolidase